MLIVYVYFLFSCSKANKQRWFKCISRLPCWWFVCILNTNAATGREGKLTGRLHCQYLETCLSTWWQRRSISVKFIVTFMSEYCSVARKKKLTFFLRSYPTARYVGIYKIDEPALLIRDLDLIKDILVTKFNVFNKNDFAADAEVRSLMS